jgi:hypothetical protein
VEQIVKNIRSALRKAAGAADPVYLAPLTGIAFRWEFPADKVDNRLTLRSSNIHSGDQFLDCLQIVANQLIWFFSTLHILATVLHHWWTTR